MLPEYVSVLLKPGLSPGPARHDIGPKLLLLYVSCLHKPDYSSRSARSKTSSILLLGDVLGLHKVEQRYLPRYGYFSCVLYKRVARSCRHRQQCYKQAVFHPGINSLGKPKRRRYPGELDKGRSGQPLVSRQLRRVRILPPGLRGRRRRRRPHDRRPDRLPRVQGSDSVGRNW